MYRTLKDKRLWFALALVLGTTAGADLAWKEYSDRWEGIRGTNTAGGFEFLGVYAEPAPKARGAEEVWVSVPLRQAAELKVRVWEPHSGYTMVPKRRTFKPGKAFSWQRARVLMPSIMIASAAP